MKSNTSATISIFILTALLGCKGPNGGSPFPTAGHYEGLLILDSNKNAKQALAKGDLVFNSKYSFSIQVHASIINQDIAFSVDAKNPKAIKMVSPNLPGSPFILQSISENCFGTGVSSTQVYQARVCSDGTEFTLDYSPTVEGGTLALSLRKVVPGSTPIMETPQVYTLKALVDRGMNRSFTSLIEFQHLVQAKGNVEAAYANLIPHLSFGFLNGLIQSPTSFLKNFNIFNFMGDLLPFLFPDRWYKAKAAQFQSQAELQGYLVMRADSANIVEGMSYGLLRDRESLARLKLNRNKIKSIVEDLKAREDLGVLPVGASDNIASLLNAVDQSVLNLEQIISTETTSLAQAAGFANPSAISQLDPVFDEPQALPADLDSETTARLIAERSLELKQLDLLIAAAKLTRTERYYNWVDPSGGSALGIGIIPGIKIANSQLRENVIKRDQIVSILMQKSRDAFNGLDFCAQNIALSQKNVELQFKRVERLTSQMEIGASVPLIELAIALQDQVKSEVDLTAHKFNLLIIQAKLNRLLFAGLYAKIDETKFPGSYPENDPSKKP